MSQTEVREDPRAIAKAAGLPPVVGEYAAAIIEKLRENHYTFPHDGRTYPAAVYLAARDEGEPVNAEEIASVAGIEQAAVSREFSKLKKARGIVTDIGDPEKFIRRYGETLGLSEDDTIAFAIQLYEDASERGIAIVNRTPSVTAAMCLYAANCYTEEDPSLTLSAFEQFGIAEVSVRLNYRDLFAVYDGDPREKSHRMNDYSDTEQIAPLIDDLHGQLPNVPEVVVDRAHEIAESIRGEEWVLNKIPESIAAACYWLATKEYRVQISQEEIAEKLGTHKVTVSRRVQEMRDRLDLGDTDPTHESAA